MNRIVPPNVHPNVPPNIQMKISNFLKHHNHKRKIISIATRQTIQKMYNKVRVDSHKLPKITPLLKLTNEVSK